MQQHEADLAIEKFRRWCQQENHLCEYTVPIPPDTHGKRDCVYVRARYQTFYGMHMQFTIISDALVVPCGSVEYLAQDGEWKHAYIHETNRYDPEFLNADQKMRMHIHWKYMPEGIEA